MSSGTWPKPHSLVRIRRSRGKCFNAGLDPLSDHVDRLDLVAALIDDAEAKVALEVPELPEVHQIVAERAMLEQHLVNLHLAERRREIDVFGEVDALAPRIAAANVQADADGFWQRVDQLVENVGGPFALLGRLRPHRLVELNVGATGGDDLVELLLQDTRPGAAEGLIVGIEILPLVDAETGQHMRAGHRLLDAHAGRRRVAGELPVVGEMEARILDRGR